MNKDNVRGYVSNLSKNNNMGKFSKSLLAIGVIVLSNLPILFGWFVFWLLGPVGFWQVLVALIAEVVFLSVPQIWFWVLGFCGLVAILDLD